jgi:hypothetical protein
MRCLAVVAVFLFASSAYSRDHDWKKGIVVGIDEEGYSRHSSIVKYRIAGDSEIYEGRITYTGGRIKGLHVNRAVEYDIDKGHVYLRDSHGRAHTLLLIRRRRQDASP